MPVFLSEKRALRFIVMHPPGTEPNTPHNLGGLEQTLQLPLLDFQPSIPGFGSRKLMASLDLLPTATVFGVLIRVPPQHNLLRKLFSLLLTLIHQQMLTRQLVRQRAAILGNYGIYPTVDAPVAIYALGTPAEAYVNAHILPPLQSGLNGRLRRNIMKVVKYHPSVGGIIVVARTEKCYSSTP